MSALGSLGISVQIPYQPWLLPFLIFLVGLNLVAIFARAYANQNFWPFGVCLAGISATYIGKFQIESKPAVLIGMLLFLVGTVGNLKLLKGKTRKLQAATGFDHQSL